MAKSRIFKKIFLAEEEFLSKSNKDQLILLKINCVFLKFGYKLHLLNLGFSYKIRNLLQHPPDR